MRNRDVALKNRPRQLVAVAVVAAMSVIAASCNAAGDEAVGTTPSISTQDAASSTVASTTTAAPTTTTAVTTTTIGAVSTTAQVPESLAIHLLGSSTVYSPDGVVRVSGWVDRPASVTVAGNPAEVFEDPYAGVSTFEVFLDFEPGDHRIDVTATDATGEHHSAMITVVVDPTLERQLAYVQDIDPMARTVVADYVEFLSGDDATSAARADGVISDDEELPGGFYLRNRNPELRTLALGDPAPIVLQACYTDDGPCVVEETINLDAWVELLADPESAPDPYDWHWYGYGTAPYWLTIQDGLVIHINELYLP
jgi:hypothetical protein